MRSVSLSFAALFLLAGQVVAALPTAAQDMERMTEIEGSYALPDGRTARLFVLDRRLYIDLGGLPEELVPVAPDRYATRDGVLRLRYRPGTRRDDIVLGYDVAPAATHRTYSTLPRQRCW